LTSILVGQTAEEYYLKSCGACHTIGDGAVLGPDLKGVSERQSRDWLVKWLLDPEGVLASGDPYALKIQNESMGMVMPPSPDMTETLANSVLDYIDEQSGLAAEPAETTEVEELPFLPEDVEQGRALFSGTQLLNEGGPACIACHDLASLGSLGGGRLGPDLTRVYASLGGRPGLSAWLSSPPSATMSPIFQKQPLQEEGIHALVALFKHETEQDTPASSAALTNFLLLGLGGATVLLIVFDRLWNKRFRGVRKPLVNQSFQQG